MVDSHHHSARGHLLPGLRSSIAQLSVGDDRSLRHNPAMTPAVGISHCRSRSIEAVLFDLDGTLLDTVGDITVALNRSLDEEMGVGPLPAETVRQLIGKGARVLIARALEWAGRRGSDIDVEAVYVAFQKHYADLYRHAQAMASVYDGVRETLGALSTAGFKLGVVTNKNRAIAVDALRHAGLMGFFGVVVGGDTCATRKPDAAPILYACRELRLAPAKTLMVGDSINDVLAARAAGVTIVCVPYGYNEGADVSALPCDAFIDSLADLLPLLESAP